MSTSRSSLLHLCTRVVLVVVISVCTTSVSAVIVGTYVDADALGPTPNTTPSSAFSPTYAGLFNDGLWDQRYNIGLDDTGTPGSGATNDVMEAGPSSAGPFGNDPVPVITTTVTGLPASNYYIYAVYASLANGVNHWGIRAGISGNTLVSYNDLNGTDTGILEGTGVHVYQVLLGIASGTSISVDVSNSLNAIDERAWYEGIAYAEVPEPSSAGVILVLGALLLTLRRWRSCSHQRRAD